MSSPSTVRVSLAGHHWMLDSFATPDVPGVKVTALGVDVNSEDVETLQDAAVRSGVTLVVDEPDADTDEDTEPETTPNTPSTPVLASPVLVPGAHSATDTKDGI